jgi:hypothetical protein
MQIGDARSLLDDYTLSLSSRGARQNRLSYFRILSLNSYAVLEQPRRQECSKTTMS